jgi:hypothetical protein
MRKFCLVLFSVCLLSCSGLAQVKLDNQWKCGKPSDQHSINVGDKPGHAYAVDQINCTSPKGEVDGVKRQSGIGTEFLELKGDSFTGHGEFVETMATGDKNVYTYQMTGTLKNGVLQSGSDKWALREGSGKLKGAKASGTCKGTSNPDQSVTWDCTGDYVMAKK